MAHEFESRLRRALQAHSPQRVEVKHARDAAVLIPVAEHPEPTLVLTVRTETLPSHKGQISFPGGSIDPADESEAAAALREANEEIGLDPATVRVIGQLDSIPTFVSGYVVTPVVGWLGRLPELRPNPTEVSELLFVPISELVDEIRRDPGFYHGGRSFPTEAWIYDDRVIWGVTARILRMFLSLLAEAGLAERPGRTDSWSAWRP